MKAKGSFLVILISLSSLVCLVLCACGANPSMALTRTAEMVETITPTFTSTPEPTPTNTPTPPPTETPSRLPTGTPLPSETPSPFVSLTPTASLTPTSTAPPLPLAFDLPAWIADPSYSILAMISDVTETANRLTFLNADTLEQITLTIPNANISRYFWTSDGKNLGFLASDFLSVDLVDLPTGIVTRYEISEQATQCLDEYDREKRWIILPIEVYRPSPADASFFCPPDNYQHIATLEDQSGEATLFLEDRASGERRQLTQAEDGLDDLIYAWSPTESQIAVLQGIPSDLGVFSPMGARIAIYDAPSGNVVASFEGDYCAPSWSPDGKMILIHEANANTCYGDTRQAILYPENGQKKRITAIEEANHVYYLDVFEWSGDSHSFYYIYINPGRSDLCIYDLRTDSVSCPTAGFEELTIYNVEHYLPAPNGQFFVFSYGYACYGCDEWGEPYSALIRRDGGGFYPFGKEIFRYDIREINRPYPYYTMSWRPVPAQ